MELINPINTQPSIIGQLNRMSRFPLNIRTGTTNERGMENEWIFAIQAPR